MVEMIMPEGVLVKREIYRSIFVWVAGVVLVLGSFLIFVATGWPGSPDPCLLASPNVCFCESFNPNDVHNHSPGVRQPMNTWFNLYALASSFLVALIVSKDRAQRAFLSQDHHSLMRSDTWIPDLYIFAILFLGLGSMWFHASLIHWAGNFDALSMYIFATFPTIYTIRRLWDSNLVFWIAYFTSTFTISALHMILTWQYKTLLLIIVLFVAYMGLEVTVNVKRGRWWGGRRGTVALWWSALAALAMATTFWALSQTGQALCDPSSAFQAHGMLWHPLAGVTALLMFFYWRVVDEGVMTSTTVDFEQENSQSM